MADVSRRYSVEPHQELMIRLQLLSMEEKRSLAVQNKAQLELERYLSVHEELEAKWVAVGESNATSGDHPTLGPDLWLWPTLRRLRAWENWRTQSNLDKFAPNFSRKGDLPRIAFLLGGGVGDILKGTTLFNALRDRFGAEIHAFVDNGAAREVLRDNPYLASTNIISRNPYEFAKNVLEQIPLFDLIVTWRYAVNYALPPKSRLNEGSVREIIALSDKISKPYRIYYAYNDVWPTFNNGLGRDMISEDWKVLDVAGATSGLGINRHHSIPFTPDNKSLSIVEPHRSRPFVTVHHGYDLNNLPPKTIATSYGSTKNISSALWAEILEGVSRLGLEIIQLGTTSEEQLPGVQYVYNGQTSFSETAMLIKNAVCHIDTEGGLVHLARAVHTRAIVLFGPTPAEIFGYSQNLNLEPSGCKACWYSTANWIVQCPRQTAGPDCMNEHRSIDVVSAVRQVLAENGNTTVDLLFPDKENATVDPLDLAIKFMEVRGRRFLIVADHDCSVLARRLAAHDADIEIVLTNVDSVGSLLDARNFTNAPKLASPYNLPQESGAFDCMFASLRDWNSPYNGQILREALRTIKNGGLLSASSPEDCPGMDLHAILENADMSLGEIPTSVGREVRHFLLGIRRSRDQDDRQVGGSSNRSPAELAAAAASAAPRLIARLQEDIGAARGRIRENLKAVHDLVERREEIDDAIWNLKDGIGRMKAGPTGWISFSIDNAAPDIMAMLSENWGGLEPWGVWGLGSRHTLLLPLFEGVKPWEYIEVQVVFALLPSEDEGSRIVNVRSGNRHIARIICREYETEAVFLIPGGELFAEELAELEFDVGYPVEPAVRWPDSIDTRKLGLGMVRLRYRVLQE